MCIHLCSVFLYTGYIPIFLFTRCIITALPAKEMALRGGVVSICLGVCALVISLLAFLLAVIIWADPKLVPNIKSTYYQTESTSPEGKRKPEPDSRTTPGERDTNIYIFAATPTKDIFQSWVHIGAAGQLSGLSLDIYSRACQRAQRRCRFVSCSSAACWDQGSWTSQGLLRRYYDGCLNMAVMPAQIAGYSFSEPVYDIPRASALYSRAGGTHNENDIGAVDIGFIEGYLAAPACLMNYTKKNIPAEKIKLYNNAEEFVQALNEGQIKLGFAGVERSLQQQLRVINEYQGCSSGKMGLMTRKGSPITTWMTDAIRQLKSDGTLKKLCENAQNVYGDSFHYCDFSTSRDEL